MKKGKRLIEILAAILVIIMGLAVYLALSRKKESDTPPVYDYRNRDLIEAFNAYRMEQFDKAEILFLKLIDDSRRKKIKSIANLYIGNIYFKMGNFVVAGDFFQKSISLDSRNIHAYYNAALAALNRGDENKALKYSQQALEINAKFIPNLILLGNIHYVNGRYDEALEIIAEIEGVTNLLGLKGSPDSASLQNPSGSGNSVSSRDSARSRNSASSPDPKDSLVYAILKYNAACTYLRSGEGIRAQALFMELYYQEGVPKSVKGLCSVKLFELTQDPDYVRNAIDIFPSSSVLRYNLALDLYERTQYEEAITLLRAIFDRSSMEGGIENRKVETLYGRSLFMGGYYREALEFYSDLYSEEESLEIAQIIGDIYVKLSDSDRAREYYVRALDDYRNETVFLNLFRLFLDEGDYRMARQLCADSLAIDRRNPLPFMCEAELAFREEDTPTAKKALEKALHHSSNSVDDLMKIAALYCQNEMPVNAVQIYHRILSLKPVYQPAQAGLAEVYFQTGHRERARSIIAGINGSALQGDLFYRISLLRAQVESEEGAIPIYGSLMEQFPARYEAYLNLALLHIQKGEYALAAQTVQQCLDRIEKLDKTSMSTLYSILGVSLLLSGREVAATDSLIRAHELDSSNEIPIHYLRMIGSRRSTEEPSR